MTRFQQDRCLVAEGDHTGVGAIKARYHQDPYLVVQGSGQEMSDLAPQAMSSGPDPSCPYPSLVLTSSPDTPSHGTNSFRIHLFL